MLRAVITDGQYIFGTSDFGRDIAMKIYDENDAAFNFSSYTTVRVVVENDSFDKALEDITPNSQVAASGTLVFEFSSTNYIATEGYYYVHVELEKTGEKTSTYPVRITVIKSDVTND